MPNTLIREGYIDSDRVSALSDFQDRVFFRTLLIADDAGRTDGRMDKLRFALFPTRESVRTADVERAVSHLISVRLLARWLWDGKPVLQVMRWQRRSPAQFSKYPDPTGVFKIEWVKKQTRDGEQAFCATSLATHHDPIGGVVPKIPGDVVVDVVVDGDEGADEGAGDNPPTPRGGGAASPGSAGGDLSPSRTRNDPKVNPNPTEGVARPKRQNSTPSKSTDRGPVSGKITYRPENAVLPIALDTPGFRQVWGEWCAHRAEIKKKLTPTAVKNQLLKLAEMGEPRATVAIRHSMANGWQGIFEPNGAGKAAPAAGAGGELQVTDSFVGSDGNWNDRHTQEELDAILGGPDIPPFPHVNTPRTPEEAERRRLESLKSQGGEDAGQ